MSHHRGETTKSPGLPLQEDLGMEVDPGEMAATAVPTTAGLDETPSVHPFPPATTITTEAGGSTTMTTARATTTIAGNQTHMMVGPGEMMRWHP